MSAPVHLRPLTDAERAAVKAGLPSPDAFTLRRCQMLLASAAGQSASAVARALGGHVQTVLNAIRAFEATGLACLTRRSIRPHHTPDAAVDAAACARLPGLLHRPPRDFGCPTSVWTLALVAEVSLAGGLTAARVSAETVRATPARLGVRWRRAKRWLTSPDPAYARKRHGPDVSAGPHHQRRPFAGPRGWPTTSARPAAGDAAQEHDHDPSAGPSRQARWDAAEGIRHGVATQANSRAAASRDAAAQ